MHSEPVREPAQPVSPWGALAGVLTSPAATFRAMAEQEKPPLVPGYLLQVAVIGAVTAITLPVALRGMDQIYAQMGPEAPGFLFTAMWRYFLVAVSAFEVVGYPWLAGLIIALVAMFFGQFAGGGVSLGRYFGMIGYAKVPLAIGTLIQGLLVAGADSILDVQTITLSPAALLPPDANPFLRAALTTLNPFALWYLALLAIGFAALHRTRPARGLPLALTLFLVGLLLTMSGAATQMLLSPQMKF